MSIIAESLAKLRDAVGVKYITHLPDIEDVEVEAQSEDEDAFPFKIFYGLGRGTTAEEEP